MNSDEPLARLVNLLSFEVDQLAAVTGPALEARWSPSPVPRPRDDTTERSTGAHSDPTADIALDERRMALSVQIMKSERLLEQALVAIRGVRRGLERTLERWERA